MYLDIVKQLYQEHCYLPAGKYFCLFESFVEKHIGDTEIKSYQWLEAWLEKTADDAELTDQGVFHFPLLKELFYEDYCKTLSVEIAAQLRRYGISSIEDAFKQVEVDIELSNLSALEYSYGKHFYHLMGEEPAELLDWLAYMYAYKYEINTGSIDTNQNGNYSVMAAAHNERTSLYRAITRLMMGEHISPQESANITSNWAPHVLHLFSHNEIEQRRAEKGLTQAIRVSL